MATLRSRSAWHIGVLGSCMLALSLRIFAAEPAGTTVLVSGAVKTPLTLTVADLKAFPPAQIDSATLARKSDDKEVASAVRGVRLAALLDRAALAGSDRNDWKHTVVLATASDGYQVVFSWPELVNTEVGAGVLVVFERDGQALTEREGPIALVSARDRRTGPRSVKWLLRLDVKILKE